MTESNPPAPSEKASQSPAQTLKELAAAIEADNPPDLVDVKAALASFRAAKLDKRAQQHVIEAREDARAGRMPDSLLLRMIAKVVEATPAALEKAPPPVKKAKPAPVETVVERTVRPDGVGVTKVKAMIPGSNEGENRAAGALHTAPPSIGSPPDNEDDLQESIAAEKERLAAPPTIEEVDEDDPAGGAFIKDGKRYFGNPYCMECGALRRGRETNWCHACSHQFSIADGDWYPEGELPKSPKWRRVDADAIRIVDEIDPDGALAAPDDEIEDDDESTYEDAVELSREHSEKLFNTIVSGGTHSRMDVDAVGTSLREQADRAVANLTDKEREVLRTRFDVEAAGKNGNGAAVVSQALGGNGNVLPGGRGWRGATPEEVTHLQRAGQLASDETYKTIFRTVPEDAPDETPAELVGRAADLIEHLEMPTHADLVGELYALSARLEENGPLVDPQEGTLLERTERAIERRIEKAIRASGDLPAWVVEWAREERMSFLNGEYD